MQRRGSLVAVIASALLFGTMAILTSLAYDAGAEPLPLLTWRFVLAAGMLFSLVALWDRRSLRVPGSDVARFATLALTGYGAASICFAFALRVTDAGVVAVLLYTFPAMVTVGGWIFEKRPVRRGQVMAVLVTFAGIVLVLDPLRPGVAVRPLGVALGLGAAAGYSAFSLLSARWLPGRPRLVLMSWTFGFAAALTALAGLGAAWVSGEPLAGALSPMSWSTEVWLLLGAIVLMPTFGAVVLYLEGIRGLGAPQAALVSTLEPLFTIVLAWFVLGERLAPVQLAGAGLVLLGIVFAERSARRDVEEFAAV